MKMDKINNVIPPRPKGTPPNLGGEFNKVKLVAIGGPTASGKTEASLILAKKFGGAIISCDSRQIYKEMDVSTDKIPYSLPYHDPVIFEGMEHYGINIADISKPFTLYDWMVYCRGVIEKIAREGKIPFLVGGTGLYIQSIVDNYELKQDFDPELRNELNKMSLDELQEKLKTLNPDLYEKIDVKNSRRVIRGIEKSQSSKLRTQSHNSKLKNTLELSSRTESLEDASRSGTSSSNSKLVTNEINAVTTPGNARTSLSAPFSKGENKNNSLVLSFRPDRELIRKKIENRVKKHQELGVIDEVKKLVEKYGAENEILNSTISVQEYIPFVLGKISFEQAQERVVINNYQYAKRQMTWFRKYGNTVFVEDIKEMEGEIDKFLNSNN